MCGIAGAAWTNPDGAIDQNTLDRMTDVLRHRGPDDRGTYLPQYTDGTGVALGHRRLSIIDVGGGRQPIGNEDDTVWIVFNGEIYNYVELRDDLIARGHEFRTHSDTETIVHLYEEYGLDCLSRLRGMFAFAIWDERLRRLFLARDRMGQKPLVYARTDDGLLFASEIKAILLAPGISREVDPVALDAYLTYLYVPHPRTMFRGVCKLPPAHYATFQNGQLTVRRYWQVDWDHESSEPADKLREQLRERLDEAVRLQLRSDVPLGAFLSGGVDSTAIAGLMQRHLPNPARTFTIGFPVSQYDESEFARLAARHLKTAHQELVAHAETAGLLFQLCWFFDEPFGDSSTVPTYLVSQITREQVKVALTGDGGDELFCGYPRYKTVHSLDRFDRLPRIAKRALANKLWNHLPCGYGNRSIGYRLRHRMRLLRQPADDRYVSWVSAFDARQRRTLYSPDFCDALHGADAESFVTDVMRSTRRSAGTSAMLADLQTYLPCDLLAKVDTASMAHALECRSPFMDHQVVELAASIPFRYHLDRKIAKPMLTSTFSDLIPPAIAKRPKMGFSIPLNTWLRGKLRPLVQELLLGGEFEDRSYFNQNAVERLVADHFDGRGDYSQQIWALLCLEQWHRTFIDPLTAPAEMPAYENPRRRFRSVGS
jgi:asparagine synthase (glutamine-hydrolysing)